MFEICMIKCLSAGGFGKLFEKLSLSSKKEDVMDGNRSHNEMVNLAYGLDEREYNPIVKGWGKMIIFEIFIIL